MLKFLFGLCLVSSVLPNSFDSLVWNYKKWICNTNHRCVRLQDQTPSASTRVYETQNICRLSCDAYGSLWPRPTGAVVLSHDRESFRPNDILFDFNNTPEDTNFFLGEINEIFLTNIRKECTNVLCTNSSSSTTVIIKYFVASESLSLTWNTDESYRLVINKHDNIINVNITAGTVFGARHGLETFSQLVTSAGTIDGGLVTVSSARIKDRPVYKHRGVLLDTARNFIPIKYILKTLNGMATAKMNVFHWHATDSQSFPLEISRVREMHVYGAYSHEHVYHKEDIDYIILYAKTRGIRVILELDAPAHAGNGWQWGPKAGLGDLAICVNEQPWRRYCIEPPCGQLNPLNENMYTILQEIYREFNDHIAEEETIHMGGDEVFFGCWNSSQEIKDYLYSKGLDTTIPSYLIFWSDFQRKALTLWDLVKNKKKSDLTDDPQDQVILWSSHLTDPNIIEKFLPPSRYIIQTWVESNATLVYDLLQKGYRIITSTKNAWYLDHGFWGKTTYYNWKVVYQNRIPRNPRVLGGEVCMWSEYVDENSLDGRIWPRAGAAAERLWTDPELNVQHSESRFFRFRERLLARGIRADAITPTWCTINSGECV